MNPATRKAIKNLVQRGLFRGFVTSAEIRAELIRFSRPVVEFEQAALAVQEGGVQVLSDLDGLLQTKARASAHNLADPIAMYLNSVGSVPILTQQQEVELAVVIEQGKMAVGQLEEQGNSIAASDRENLEQAVEEGKQAAAVLVEANLRLVVAIAKKFRGGKAGLLDLVQEGNLGLMRAVEKFDYRLGFKFSTYASWWIRQAVIKFRDRDSRLFRVPGHITELVSHVRQAQAYLSQRLGHQPSVQELCNELEMEPEQVYMVYKLLDEGASLDSGVDEENEVALRDTLPDTEAVSPTHWAARTTMEKRVALALECLSEWERKVVVDRFGLADGKQLSLQEVARKYNRTSERVRQVEIRAMRKLRQSNAALEEFAAFLKDGDR